MKIFTYKDPCSLWNSSDKIGDEIEGAAHFCVSEVLVQGLIAKWGREKFKCIATVDEFMKNLFPGWLSENSKDVERFLELSEIINKELSKSISLGHQDIKILKSFKKNVKGVLDAVKYLWETEEFEVSSKVVNGKTIKEYNVKSVYPKTPTEETFINKIVKTILKERSSNITRKEYWYPEWENNISSGAVADAVRGCILDEIRKEYRNKVSVPEEGTLEQKRENALAWLRKELAVPKAFDSYKRLLNDIISSNENRNNNTIVFHGMYRMRPIHFKMFRVLEEMGYEVIILNCYNPDYPKIHRLWDDLYCMLSKEFNVIEIRIGKYSSQLDENHAAGKIFGALIEGKTLPGLTISKDGNKCEFYEYLTTMQFINTVSDVFDDAKDESGKSKIGLMKEQFYGVNGIDLNQIFRIFYPEIFKKKSFMSFPLGQFIYYIHDMWDSDNNVLRLNHTGLIECLNMYNENATLVYNKIEIYIGLEREKTGLPLASVVNKIKKLQGLSAEYGKDSKDFEDLSHFGYFLEQQKYELLLEALRSLEKFASSIFAVGTSTADKHYQKLVSMIDNFNAQQGWRALEKDELQLLKEIKDRLENVKDDDNQPSADVSVLRETIDFYLGNYSGKNEVNWLVRDFEQIDGDLLLFHADGIYKSKASTVHYALVSNQNMLMGKNSGCVWPLTREAVNNKWTADMLTEIAEHDQAYRRYMLFQGLFYLPKEINVKMSYVKNVADLNNEERNHDEYFLTKGMRKAYNVEKCIKAGAVDEITARAVSKNTCSLASVNEQKGTVRVFSECPYKYMFSTALNEEAYVYNDNDFLVIKFFEEYIEYCIKRDSNNPYPITKEQWKLKSKEILSSICIDKEITDIIERAFSNIGNSFNTLNVNIPRFWVKDVREQQKPDNYPAGEPWRSRISQYNLNQMIKNFLEEYWDGFEVNGKEYAVSEYTCEYCTQKAICLYPYRMEAYHLIRKEEKQFK